MASSLDGQNAAFASDWCFHGRADLGYNWWLFHDPSRDTVATARARNTLAITFSHEDNAGARKMGSILVGFEASGEAPAQRPSALTGGAGPVAPPLTCHLGEYILAQAPIPVASVPTESQIPKVTVIDPAPAYRWWYFRGQPHKVRTILYIPVSYRTGPRPTPGHIIVAFGD